MRGVPGVIGTGGITHYPEVENNHMHPKHWYGSLQGRQTTTSVDGGVILTYECVR